MKNPEDKTEKSPNQRAIMRLKRNKPALFGILVIAIATFMAILGYTIAPDSTPNANLQLTEIQLKDPGFEIDLLKVHKNQEIQQHNFLYRMLYGQPTQVRYFPINQYTFQGDSILIEKYAGEDGNTGATIQGKEMKFHLLEVKYGLNDADLVTSNNDLFEFKNLKGEQLSISKVALQSEIEEMHIETKKYWLGTDVFGRSMLSRLILGVRISLIVGLIAVLISLTIGIALGAIAGYLGGRVDDMIMLLINTVWSIPTLLLVFAIVLAMGRGISIIFLAVGLTMWVDVARIVRGQVMGLKEIQFIEAAQSMGFSRWRVIGRHILPNILGPVMVIAAANFATAILIEAGLSYLGFGIQPPTPSWGTLLNENYGYAISGKPMLALVPAIAIMLMVLAFNLVGNGFRDALDVQSNQ